MSLKKIFASVAHAVDIGSITASGILSTAALASVRQLGNSLAGPIAAAGDQANSVRADIAAGIKAANNAAAANPTMMSSEKLTTGIGVAAPAIITEAVKFGLTAELAEAERFAEMAIENELSLVKVTPLAKLAAALLHDIGVNV